MATTVFCMPVNADISYEGDPVDVFRLSFRVKLSSSLDRRNEDRDIVVRIPVGTSPAQVYQTVFDEIVNIAENDVLMETPTKDDVYGYIPMTFSVLLPE